MSKYGWEHGSIKIPSAVFTGLKKEFVTKVKDKIEKDFAIYDSIVKYVKAATIKPSEVLDFFETKLGKTSFETICPYSLFHYSVIEGKKGKSAIKKLTLKEFTTKVGLNKEGVNASEYSIYFSSSIKSVIWNVPRNNHAVEDAKKLAPAKILFSLLRNVAWTANTGGVIEGNDEYNEDADGGEEMSTPYVSMRFGLKG